MKNQTREQIIAAITLHTETAVLSFLHDPVRRDRVDAKETLINLVLTLKSWARPKGPFLAADNIKNANNFQFLHTLLINPETILPSQQTKFTETEKVEILALLYFKLEQLANELIKHNHLQAAILARKEKSIQVWWEGIVGKKAIQEEIEQQFNNLPPALQTKIRLKVGAGSDDVRVQSFNTNLYYYLCDQRPLLLKPKSAAQLIGINTSYSPYFSKIKKDDSLFESSYLHMIGVSLGIIPAFYVIQKGFRSLRNYLFDYKLGRSFARLVGIDVGAVTCGVIGASVGSGILPGLGTVIGAVFGAIIGGAGAALISKYTAQKISSIQHSDELNPTNPEKYRLTEEQKEELRTANLNLTSVEEMMLMIRNEKKEADGFLSIIPFTNAYKKKRILNTALLMLKNADLRLETMIGPQMINPTTIKQPADRKTSTTLLNERMGATTAMQWSIINDEINAIEMQIMNQEPKLDSNRPAPEDYRHKSPHP